ncbi:MAG: hypothetical protein H8D23_00380 [Candidatus Brocadiales bacterium]|nr:hypothetical protein [Candidatus Brocadiales bacterium]
MKAGISISDEIGNKLSLTVDEARELFWKLEEIFGADEIHPHTLSAVARTYQLGEYDQEESTDRITT